jgi:hypothetical protein
MVVINRSREIRLEWEKGCGGHKRLFMICFFVLRNGTILKCLTDGKELA